jgi:hypothetical protein
MDQMKGGGAGAINIVTIGALSVVPPVEPEYGAVKAKIPPSEATSQ